MELLYTFSRSYQTMGNVVTSDKGLVDDTDIKTAKLEPVYHEDPIGRVVRTRVA